MHNKKFNLTGKTALITGAAGLLGYEHACALLEIKCNLVLTDIDLIKLNNIKSELEEIIPTQIFIFTN